MRVCCFLGFLALAFATNNFIHKDDVDIYSMIRERGYPAQKYKVNTSDGYILDLYRIPRGRLIPVQQGEGSEEQQEYEEEQVGDGFHVRKNHQRKFKLQRLLHYGSAEVNVGQSDEAQLNWKPNRPAILLMHGYMSSPEDFVVNNMALELADNGYDVYLGSSRGSRYGQHHRYLNPNKDPAFWLYCFDDIGKKDLPAIVDKVLEISNKEVLSYIGHMEGSTIFYIMGSELPRYLKKIDTMVSLGPIAYMQHSTNKILKTVAKNLSHGWLLTNVGTSKVQISNKLAQVAKDDCDNSISEICENNYFLVNGYNSEKFNQTIINQVENRVPFGGSARELIHFAQFISTGRFQSYDPSYENLITKQYHLSRINVPVAVFYSKNDSISSVVDVQRLIDELPNVYYSQKMLTYSNNLDLVYGTQLNRLIRKIITVLKQGVVTNSSL